MLAELFRDALTSGSRWKYLAWHAIGRAVRSVLSEDGTGIGVPVVDLIARHQGMPIDLLKIDIEGSEHAC